MPNDPLNNDQTGLSEPLPINTTGSEPVNMPSEAPESPINRDTPIPLNNDNPENTPILTENPEVLKIEVLPAEGGKTEEIPESTQTPETATAQIPPNEPLDYEPKPIKSEPVSVSNYGEAKAEPENINPVPVVVPNKNKVLELLNKAKLAIQSRKRKKLEKIMTLFLKSSKITNDEVEKFLHVSDATAERYLNILEKENKIKQIGKSGHAVSYTKI